MLRLKIKTTLTIPLLMLLSMVFPGSLSFADVAPPDWRQNQSDKVWEERIRPEVFGDREITSGTVQNIVELKAPYRAEDATVVPISIHTKILQSPENYIQKIHIFIDKNPVPLVGTFIFTPESGKADLAMRVRVDDQTYIRAVAEMNNGDLYMSKSFIRATGACSAPPPKSIDDSIANMGSIKLKTIGELELTKPNLVQLMIKHPNITGLQPMRIGARVMPPAHFINEVSVDFEGRPVMKAQLTFSVSMDPSFRFFFVPGRAGVMHVEAKDTKNNRWTSDHKIGNI